MKVVIIAAGSSAIAPKCLYNHRDEIILERQTRIMNSLGLMDVRIVLGCKSDEVLQFIKKRDLSLEVKFLEDPILWDRRGLLETLQIGLIGVDDDVLLLPGDLYVESEGFRKALTYDCSVVGMRYNCLHFFLIRKNLFPIIHGWGRRFKPGSSGRKKTSIFFMLDTLILENGGVAIQTKMYDLDRPPKKRRYDDEGYIIYPSRMRR